MATFHFRKHAFYCEDIQIDDFLNSLPKKTHRTFIDGNRVITVDEPSTPMYIYSSEAIKANVKCYLDAMKKYSLQGTLGYAVKANGNLELLRLLKSFGIEILVTVSGNEIIASLKAGFAAEQILFNGNGKQDWEIKLAVEEGVLLNADSIFDAERIVTLASQHASDKKVKVLLRLRPGSDSCDIGVHPYTDTSQDSKFGFGLDEIDHVVQILTSSDCIQVYGVHCHLGSCILNPNIYKYMGSFLTSAMKILSDKGIEVQLCDIGGGIGIDYRRQIPDFPADEMQYTKDENQNVKVKTRIPDVEEYLKVISDVLPANTKILIEPGRSLVGNAGIIVTKVLGYKKAGNKNYAIVDVAMTELIRPPLYGSFHQIVPTKVDETIRESSKEWTRFDVVGPVCESADFLGKDIRLPDKSDYLVIMDCGAYAASMGSNYNMRPKPAEVLVNGKTYECIRDREQFDDLISKIC